ncbi:MAG: TerC family protein [Saprospiraceae bacterium]|nr:TerC family protein [Saprospiraceae bacterium]
MNTDIQFWIYFTLFILAMLAIDLGIFHRKSHAVSFKESLMWTFVWLILAMLFNTVVYFWKGPEKSFEFLTGYIIELSLSVDNLFLFILIFKYFHVPVEYQHRVLFWGILGALVMRVIFIFAGIALITQFHWIIYVFGAFIIFTGVRMLFQSDQEVHPERNVIIKGIKKVFPVTKGFYKDKFFINRQGILIATPLFIVLVFVEITDLIFAVDSIPAILAITTDPFIVFTSNVFAILGLRSLYFSLAGMMGLFRFLHIGLAAILIFIGLKMVLADIYKLPIEVALMVVLAILVISIMASLIGKKPKAKS